MKTMKTMVKLAEPLVGRDEELRTLEEAFRSGRPELVAVYGRRRVGKTFLVRKAFGDRFAFQHAGLSEGGMKDQLEAFADSMRRAFGTKGPPPATWIAAFGSLAVALSRRRGRKVVFLDELPWMDTPNARFMPALEHFWNGWASGRDDVVLVVCGSAASWIVRKIVDNYGGLHDRLTHLVRLVPFTLGECRRFAAAKGLRLSDRQLADLYLAFGGIPFYWSLVRRGESPAQAVDRLCFGETGGLHGEFGRLYASLFRRPEPYVATVEAMARRSAGMTREELLAAVGQEDNGAFSRILEDLESCGFVRRYRFPGKKERDSLWQLLDPFTLFHIRFLADDSRVGRGNWLAGASSHARTTWSGLAFERLCLQHVPQIKRALGIAGVSTAVHAARIPPGPDGEPGAQIDLVLDRADGIANLCEMKYSSDLFAVSSKYRSELLAKVSAYQRAFGVRKTVHVTLVTAAGLRPNENADVVQSEVRLADLFADS